MTRLVMKTPRKKKDGGTYWHTVGTTFMNDDGTATHIFDSMPLPDDQGRVVSIMTQGDFVSYTWPNLLHQAREVTRTTVGRNYQILLVGGSVAAYTLILIVVLASFFGAEA